MLFILELSFAYQVCLLLIVDKMKSSSKFSCIVPTTASQLCLPSDAPCYYKQQACLGCLQAYGLTPCLEWQLELLGHYGNALAPPTLQPFNTYFEICSQTAVHLMLWLTDDLNETNMSQSISDSVDDSNDQLFISFISFFVLHISILRLCRCSFDRLQKCLIDNNRRVTQKNDKNMLNVENNEY